MMVKNDITHNSNKQSIYIHLDIDYDIYKKKIKKYIIEHFKIIFDLFNDEFNENVVKLYILLKKNLLEEKYIKYINLLIDFVSYLQNLEYIDQQEYFLMIMKLLNINILINNIKDDVDDNNLKNKKKHDLFNNVKIIGNKYVKLINLEYINNKINECLHTLSKNNIVVEIFLNILNNENSKNTKSQILFLSEKMSFDLFPYWSPHELYNIIIKNVNSATNELYKSIKKYKDSFIKNYNQKTLVLKKLYIENIDIIYSLKYKINKNNLLFDDLMNDLKIVELKFKNE